MALLLHLPVDWERKFQVHRLRLRLEQLPDSQEHLRASLYYLRIWTEWASNPTEWRPLSRAVVDPAEHPWENEDLALAIEFNCEWKGPHGRLIRAAVAAEVFLIEKRGDLFGLVCAGWWECNAHLAPGHKTIQQKGGYAANQKNEARKADTMADQQVRILQAGLLFSSVEATPEEHKKAVSLIIQLDRSCGLPVRATGTYTEALLCDALSAVRTYPDPAIQSVLSYLQTHRNDPQVVKVPDSILKRFPEVVDAAAK